MRCLYCGKELALFKRLRGGEFCSDAHRQHYQEEYTQLALNRLLQANSPGESDSAKPNGAKGSDTKASEVKPLESPALKRRERNREETPAAPAAREPLPLQSFAPGAGAPAPAEAAQQIALLDPEPVVIAPEPPAPEPEPPVEVAAAEPEPVPEEPPPAGLASLFIEVPLPAVPEAQALSKPETGLLSSATPQLPPMLEFRLDPDSTALNTAGPVQQPRSAPTDSDTPLRERGLEVRDFVRPQALVEIRLAPAGEAGFTSSGHGDTQTDAEEMMEVDVDPLAPPDPPQWWQESPREFPIPSVVLVESARLDFETTGWGDAATNAPREAPRIEIPKPEPPATRFFGGSEQARAKATSADLFSPNPQVSLDPIRLAGLTGSKSEPPPAAGASSPAQTLIPEAVTKPLPLTLHGLAPARGKPLQVFSSALPRPAEIQTPRPSALPLRPAIVLGPADPAQLDAKVPAEKQVRPVNGPNVKLRKSEVRVLPLNTREEPKKEAKPEFKLEIKRVLPQPRVETPKPEAPKPELVPPASSPAPASATVPALAAAVKKESPEPVRPAAKETRPAPAPQSKPAAEDVKPKEEIKPRGPVKEPAPPPPAEADLLGLPKLDLEAEGSFWTKLPAAARIGLAAGILAAIAGGIFLTSKGSSATRAAAHASQEPPVVAAAAPIGSDAGWATDWFTDGPGSRQARHVDVLKGSLTLRDYRMEFEGQIEQQAIGWVFRASTKGNFYVEKVEIVTPGLEPTVALTRFAVIGGKEQPRVQVPLPVKAHLDTLYRIRTDVVGQRFTTWVQDQKVDEWTDGRIEAGGAGLYYDGGDSAKLKGTITLTPLKAR